MDFWNDYEGKVIAGSYPLERLLHPEGRSGFFATSNGTGTPAVIRLTESLNDQAEMFAQWQAVQELEHPNLVIIRNYGQTLVDEAPLIYAVLEPADADLSEMLPVRAMTVEETREIAESLAGVLRALHARGLVHGHIEPSAVVAVGEVVKFRSDCVRKVPEGPEGESLKAQDVKDLAALLLQSLTQQRSRYDLPLAPPFDEIVRKGSSGAWGLEEISRALAAAGTPAAARAAAAPERQLGEIPLPGQTAPVVTDASIPDSAKLEEEVTASPVSVERAAGFLPSGMGPWIGVALVLLAAIVAWYVFNPLTPEQRAIAESRPLAGPVSAPLALPFAPKASPQGATPAPAAGAPAAAAPNAVPQPGTTASQEVWRVVAYTYNQESQAQAKAAALRRTHNSMKPDVFTPTGKAPFLVTLGGPMSHDEALAFKKKARTNGLPRDIYAQNYASK